MTLCIARYQIPGDEATAWGVVVGDTVHELEGDVFGPFGPGRPVARLEALRLLAPVKPTKIVCVGRNYAAHAAELGNEIPKAPLLFLKPPSSIIGPGEAIAIPEGVGRVDYEGEIALVMRQKACRIDAVRVPEHVLGCTCLNDVTARALQKKDRTFARAKGFDTFCPVGPVVVTGDIRRARRIRTFVNGHLRQDGTTEGMIFDACTLVSYISHIMTLLPGDIIATGTPPGVGPLAEGDEVVVEIEGLGRLANPVEGRL